MTGQNVVATIEQPGSTAVAPRQAITPMEMLQIAVEKGATVEQLERLMALQERWEASEARKAYIAAKAAFNAEAPQITKNKHVGFETRGGDATEYDHATLDHITETLGPVLSKHGLTYSWETDQVDGYIRVTCVLTHVLGHSERVTLQGVADQSGKKNAIQAIGSTVTYLQRYTLLAVTGMATKGQDSDGRPPVEYISESQAMDLEALAIEVKADKNRFLRYLKVNSFSELPASRYQEAVAALERKRGSK